ncbi:MAG: zf-HC2 domain-containing protein [Bacteroides sp.]|nr:zf-HC2 domain-containing protein [Bacteroides sp.]
MKLSCEIVRDLLPLYSDNVCSEESRAAVEEHLTECIPCREELKSISDNKPVSVLYNIGEALILGTYRRTLLKKLLFFALCAVIFPLISAFLCYSVRGEEHIRTFIVTAVLLLAYVYIPASARKNRELWITVSSVVAPAAVILAYDIVRDNIIFLNSMIEYGSGAMFGFLLTLILLLIYIAVSVIMFFVNKRAKPLKPSQYRSTAFRIMVAVTAVDYCNAVMGALTNVWYDSENTFIFYLLRASFDLAFIWLGFLVFRTCKGNIFIRLGFYSLFLGIYVSTWNTFTDFITGALIFENLGSKNIEAFWKADLLNDSSSSNLYFVTLIISLVTSGIFTAIGIGKKKKDIR